MDCHDSCGCHSSCCVVAFRGQKEEQINFKQEKVATHTLQNSITATGTIEAVTSVTVGTQVSGIVNKLYVDYNSVVKKVR